jgi:diguanylate cyclase (GGDEF)-like protein
MFLNSDKNIPQEKNNPPVNSKSQINRFDSADIQFIAALPEMANTSSSAEEFISRSQTRLIRSLGFNQIATWHLAGNMELLLSGAQAKHRTTKDEIQNWISENKTLVDECLQNESVQYFSKENSNFILVPHRKRNTLFGMSLVEKSNSEKFTDSEIRLLQIYGHQFAVSFENAKLQEGSTHDNLTKLYNAKFFHNRITSELLIADQTESPLSLLLFDIDHFKKFNDTYGHATGDLVLEKVASTVQKVCRGSDIVCRYGGEEFAIILVDTNSPGGKIVAEKIRNAVESLILDPTRPEIKVTISVGVAAFPNHASNKDSLINCADEAMYDCKKAGRNCSQIYSKKS